MCRTAWANLGVRAVPGAGLWLALAVACGGSRAESPETVVRDFAQALENGEYDDAYAQLSVRYRQRVPLEEFRRQMQTHPEEVAELVGLMQFVEESGEIKAVVPFPDGETLELVRQEQGWRIVGNAVDFYDQSSPRTALRSFVRAMERRRYDVILRFVPNADREGMTEDHMRHAWEGDAREEIEQLVAMLRANLDQPIEVVGDRATMTYGEGASVEFVREDGVWRIEDPD